MQKSLLFMALVPACTSGNHETGPATYTRDGITTSISAFASDIVDNYVLGPDGTTDAYIPWTISLEELPAGSSCGEGRTALWRNLKSALAKIRIVVPFSPGDDPSAKKQISPGVLAVGVVSSRSYVTSPMAEVQVFGSSEEFTGGTLTITAFTEHEIVGELTAGTVASTFTAPRCTFEESM